MKITVTQKHIDKGQRTRTHFCPIALAIHEKKPNHAVLVVEEQAMIWPKGDYWNPSFYSIPKEGQQFIRNFDNGCNVQPITLTLKKIRK